MEIIKYAYRKPDWLQANKLEKLDSIAIHHTGNSNNIDQNTDYHRDVNAFNWLGYNFYIVDGIIYEVRGIHHQGAAVKHHNGHILSIAIQGNFDNRPPKEEDLVALQWLVSYLKEELPQLEHINGHKRWNQTSCPGALFPIDRIKLEGFKKEQYATVEDVDNLRKELKKMKAFLEGHYQVRIR